MKIALINGSPKAKGSASGVILQGLKNELEHQNELVDLSFRNPTVDDRQLEKVKECEVLVFAFPLYVDGIPSHMISVLMRLETILHQEKEKQRVVYAIVNCGFYEGRQNTAAIKMMEHWCAKSGCKWGGGIGVGAGGMLAGLDSVPMGHGPKKNLGTALRGLSQSILKRVPQKNSFITANFPRFAYKIAAEYGWRKGIKANGLTVKDLFLER